MRCTRTRVDLFQLALIVGGLVLIVAVASRGLRLGRLPGDVSASRGNFRIYAPLGTSLLISIVLTVLLNAALCGVQR